jgi:hypothetical protein
MSTKRWAPGYGPEFGDGAVEERREYEEGVRVARLAKLEAVKDLASALDNGRRGGLPNTSPSQEALWTELRAALAALEKP